jgi:putative inorganic carbon (hco3(-)) transporter
MIGTALAFGGVQPISYSLMEIVLFFVVLLVLFTEGRRGRSGLYLPIWPLLFALWAALQFIPLPVSWVIRLSPARALDPNIAAAHSATLSINAHDTTVMLMKFLAYLAAFVLAAYFFDSGKRKSTLLAALMALAIFEAAYGAVQYLTGWQKIFTYTKQYYTTEATGTYINHNHFAGLLELALPFVVASVFYHFQPWSEGRVTDARNRRVPGTHGSEGLRSFFYLFLAVIVVVGAICSKSRGGIVGTALSVVLVAVLAQLKIGRRVWLAGLVLFLVSVGAYGMWIGLGPLAERFQAIGQKGYLEEYDLRVPIWRDDLWLIHDYPLAGTGLGTFGLSFRHYQTTGVNLFFDHTHNDYLEVASDSGLVGAALLFVPILVLLARLIGSFLSDSRRYRRSVTLGCIGSVAALLVHSTTDFNLQIPANALIFAVVLGIGYKAAVVERRLERQLAVAPAAVAVAR